MDHPRGRAFTLCIAVVLIAVSSFAEVTAIPMETSIVRRPDLSAAAPRQLGALGLVPAPTFTWTWYDGSSVYGSYVNFPSGTRNGNVELRAGFQGDINSSYPKVGDLFYLRNYVQVNGNPSTAGVDCWQEISMPQYTHPYVTQTTPIQCWYFNGSAWTDNTNDPSAYCPQNLNSGGIYLTYSLGQRTVPSYKAFFVSIPVFATKAQPAFSAEAVFSVTNSSGITSPGAIQTSQWAGVLSNPSTIDYPSPSATSITNTGATLNGNLYSHFTSGNAYFEYGTTTSYGTPTAMNPISDQNNVYTVYEPITGLTAGTTYHFRLVYLSASGNATGIDQTFTTTGTPPTTKKTLGDFQGDGKGDLLWRNGSSGSNSVWLMDGGAVAASGALPPVFDPNFKVVGIGDFQGDGKADVLWRNSSTGANVVWLMNGLGVAASAVLQNVSDPNWTVAGIGDFQGDGKADILWRNTVTGSNSIWFMNGLSVGPTAAVTAVPDTNFKVAAIGDFQHDGKADIMWRNTSTGSTSIWLMDGPNVAVSASLAYVDPAFEIVGSGDFQGDGKTDVLWRNKNTGANVIWFMNGTALGVTAVLSPVGDTSWKVARVVDIQGDGKADIIWRNSNTGSNAFWLLDGGNIAVSGSLPPVGNTAFQVASTP